MIKLKYTDNQQTEVGELSGKLLTNNQSCYFETTTMNNNQMVYYRHQYSEKIELKSHDIIHDLIVEYYALRNKS